MCEYTTKDILNLGGHAKKHLIQNHNIHESNYIDYYKEIDKPIIEMWKCPECEWKTKDLKNVSGWITSHIIKTHNIEMQDFLIKYPEYLELFNKQSNIIKRNYSLLESNIECKICGMKFYKLSQTHLQKHGITPTEYKIKFGIKNTASQKTSKLQTEKSNDPKIKSKMIQTLLKTNNTKYGVNSYTQTKEGKENVRLRTITNTYTKYASSKKLSEHVQMLFDISEYDGTRNKQYKFLCKKCNVEFYGSLENGRIPRCFSCYPKINKGYSNTEKEIASFIKNELNINIQENYKIDGVEVDIYISEYKFAIEFDGLYWHSEISGEKKWNYHLNKTDICEAVGVFLIHIFEDEWIYKKDVVKSKIRNMLGLTLDKVYARKCEIKEISVKEKNEFLDMYHLQGTDNISMNKIGLFYNDVLISVMSLTKYKYIKDLDNVYELSRFATKSDIILVGGFSKSLKYFIEKYNPKSIITFADRRWSKKENVYTKNGFELTNITQPSYWYFNKAHNRQHRFNYRKSLLEKKLDIYDENLSEWENMQLNGYDRIWDCGNFRYELVLIK